MKSGARTYYFMVPLTSIHVCERFPDRDTSYIFEHLKYVHSRPSEFPLPNVRVQLVDGELVAIEGQVYLRIARELGITSIRCALQAEVGDPAMLTRMLPAGAQMVPNEVFEREASAAVGRGFHVFFFERPLSDAAKQGFREDIAGCFEKADTPLIGRSEQRLFSVAFPFDGLCGEFEALIPIGDQSCTLGYLAACVKFSREVQRIISFQGRRNSHF